MIKCKICKKLFRVVSRDHLKYKHNITVEKYKKKYNVANLCCKATRKLRSKNMEGNNYTLGYKRSKENKEKLKGNKNSLGHKHTKEFKKNIRKRSLAMWEKGILTEEKCSDKKCKWYPVKNYIGEIIKVHGTFEKRTAEALTKLGIRWEKTKHKFSYQIDNEQHTYYPDFWLPDHKLYLEVKGWIRPELYKEVHRKLQAVIKNGYNIELFFLKDIKKLEKEAIRDIQYRHTKA